MFVVAQPQWILRVFCIIVLRALENNNADLALAQADLSRRSELALSRVSSLAPEWNDVPRHHIINWLWGFTA